MADLLRGGTGGRLKKLEFPKTYRVGRTKSRRFFALNIKSAAQSWLAFQAAAAHGVHMGKVRRILPVVLLAAVLGTVVWMAIRPGDRIYNGKPENAWILSLTAPPGDAQMKEWQELGPEAVPILIHALERRNGPIQRTYGKIWERLPRATRMRLGMPVAWERVRSNAALTLGLLGVDIRRAAPSLGRALRDENQDVRLNAARCLFNLMPALGPEKESLLPDVIVALGDTNLLVREQAAIFLGYFTNQSRIAAPALARALGDPQASVRLRVIFSLNRMNLDGLAGTELTPLLVRNLSSPEAFVRVVAAEKLGEMKSDPNTVVPVLTGMLDNGLQVDRFAAARALGMYGSQARPAIPELTKVFGETNEARTQNAVSNALIQIAPDTAAKLFAAHGEEQR